MSVSLLLHNLRSTYNVGAILRTADCLGIQQLYFSGYTPCPFDNGQTLPHLQAKLTARIAKTALGAEAALNLCYYADPLLLIEQLRHQGTVIFGLENRLPSHYTQPIYQLDSPVLHHQILAQSDLLLILGEEVGGIPAPLLSLVDGFIEIPMHGIKESLNVAMAAGIAMYTLTTMPAVLQKLSERSS